MIELTEMSRIEMTLALSGIIFAIILLIIVLLRHKSLILDVKLHITLYLQRIPAIYLILQGLSILQTASLFFLSGRLFPGLAAGAGVIFYWPLLGFLLYLTITTPKRSPPITAFVTLLAINVFLVFNLYSVFSI